MPSLSDVVMGIVQGLASAVLDRLGWGGVIAIIASLLLLLTLSARMLRIMSSRKGMCITAGVLVAALMFLGFGRASKKPRPVLRTPDLVAVKQDEPAEEMMLHSLAELPTLDPMPPPSLPLVATPAMPVVPLQILPTLHGVPQHPGVTHHPTAVSHVAHASPPVARAMPAHANHPVATVHPVAPIGQHRPAAGHGQAVAANGGMGMGVASPATSGGGGMTASRRAEQRTIAAWQRFNAGQVGLVDVDIAMSSAMQPHLNGTHAVTGGVHPAGAGHMPVSGGHLPAAATHHSNGQPLHGRP